MVGAKMSNPTICGFSESVLYLAKLVFIVDIPGIVKLLS
jgi:hypothetical protein